MRMWSGKEALHKFSATRNQLFENMLHQEDLKTHRSHWDLWCPLSTVGPGASLPLSVKRTVTRKPFTILTLLPFQTNKTQPSLNPRPIKLNKNSTNVHRIRADYSNLRSGYFFVKNVYAVAYLNPSSNSWISFRRGLITRWQSQASWRRWETMWLLPSMYGPPVTHR